MEMRFELAQQANTIEADPARVVQGVIIGIGFMATATILKAQHQLIGATTGAGVWLLGAIGLACGLGLYAHAMVLTGLVLFVIVLLHPLDRFLAHRQQRHQASP
jgi:putative Mg2+ transporter-C (MgtC) family protein